MTRSAATTSRSGAAADMEKAPTPIAETLARLSAATIFELRSEWRRLHRAPPPLRLSRDLLMRGITYKLHERRLGGLSHSLLRRLERLTLDSEASGAQKPPPPISLKAGTTLLSASRAVPRFEPHQGDNRLGIGDLTPSQLSVRISDGNF